MDNPVLRHTGRFTSPARILALVLAVLTLIGIAAGVFQQFWVQYPVYSGGPRVYTRWQYLFLMAELALILPWAAIRGAATWRRLQLDGHLEEYRRTRLAPRSIVAGALYGAMKPILWLLAVSAGLGILAAAAQALWRPQLLDAAPSIAETLAAHLLLLLLAGVYAAQGQFIAAATRWPGLAGPVAIGGLIVSIAAVWGLNAVVRSVSDPDAWLRAALVPNPAAALATLLRMDLLRFGWIYDHVRALDYTSMGFAYPQPGWTAALYASWGAICLAMTGRRTARAES